MASLAAKATRTTVFRKSFLPFRQPSSRSLTTRATSYTLNTGAKIPALGFGTFQDPDSQEETVSRALQKGMRLIDTARVYNIEEEVGRAIKKSGVPREDIFLGTKLWCTDYHPDDVERALDDSLRDLDTPYVDLLLMHYPCTFKRGSDRFPRDADGGMVRGETTYIDTWKAMEKLTKTGKVKAIGVSNFSMGEIESLINESYTVSNTIRSQNDRRLINLAGASCSPNGVPSLFTAERVQRVAADKGNPRHPVQPPGQHERLLPTDWMV